MKECIYIEDIVDYQTSLDYIKSCQRKILVVSLNPDIDFDYSSYSNVIYKTELDYTDADICSEINEQGLSAGETWHEEPGIKEFLTYVGIDMGLVIEHSFSRALITTYKYVRIIRRILEQEGIKRVILVEPHPKLHRIRHITPTVKEKVANSIVIALCKVYGIQVELLDPCRTDISRIEKKGVDFDKYLRRALNPVRKMGNFIVSMSCFHSKAIVLSGAPRLIFPIIDGIRKYKRCRLIYLQEEIGPKLILPLVKKGVIYKTLSDYDRNKDNGIMDNINIMLSKNFEDLIRSKRLHKIFSFEKIDIVPALIPRLEYAFKEYMPPIIYRAIRFKRFLSSENIDAIIMDEDVKEFNRPLAMVASSMGIISLEYQHGITVHFHSIRKSIASKKLVWGDYIKQRLVEAGLIGPNNIIVVGSPHIEAITKRRAYRNIEIRKIKRAFKIQANKKIILLTPHSFKRGVRGGILGVHVDKKEVDGMLKALVKTLNLLPDVFLLLKLHHGDIRNKDYYLEMFKKNGLRTPYKITADYSVYSLLNTCDLLLTPLSTVIPEGLALKTPIVMLNFTGRTSIHPYAEWGSVACATTEDQLYVEVKRILSDREKYIKDTAYGRKKVLDKYLYGVDGKSSRRIVELIGAMRK